MKNLFASLLLAAVAVFRVADAGQPAEAAPTRTVLRVAGIVDPQAGTTERDMRLVIEGDRIVSVGKDSGPMPEGARVIELVGAFLVPGLMDTHTHLAIAAIPEQKDDDSSAFVALRAQRLAREVVEAGFTTIRDVGERGYVVSDLRRAIDLGWVEGPSIVNAGRWIAPFGGDSGRRHPVPFEDGPTWRRDYVDADSPEAVARAVRENIYYGAGVIKLVADQEPYYYTEKEIRAAVDEAHRAGRKVAVHTGGGQAARNAILGGADSIEHGFDLGPEEFKLMKERGTYLSTTDFSMPQLLVIFQGNEATAASWAQRIRRRLEGAYQAGVRLAFGTDVVWTSPGATGSRGEEMLKMIDAYKDAGIPANVTLRAMTIGAAELIGVEKDRGLLRPGFRADIVAVRRNPLDDITALREQVMVIARGKVVRDRREAP